MLIFKGVSKSSPVLELQGVMQLSMVGNGEELLKKC